MHMINRVVHFETARLPGDLRQLCGACMRGFTYNTKIRKLKI